MTNVNSAADLAQYAEENDIDLTGYGETLVEVVGWGKTIDLEPPFAADVLHRLRSGDPVADAVAAARERTLEEIRKHEAEET